MTNLGEEIMIKFPLLPPLLGPHPSPRQRWSIGRLSLSEIGSTVTAVSRLSAQRSPGSEHRFGPTVTAVTQRVIGSDYAQRLPADRDTGIRGSAGETLTRSAAVGQV
jgi:hypothetical protein